jgi:N-acetylmuramic acid 6-phosphate etherase
MAVVTDTTERAPTFSLAPFENFDDEAPVPSWAYLRIPEAPDASSAWRELLLREPRPLDWEGLAHVAGYRRMLGYDFSRNVYERRSRTAPGREQHVFRIARSETGISFSFRDLEWTVPTNGLSELSQYTLLKILLNTHSTLVMGRLGRYESNVMLWVKPSNFKLIDRSARYVLHLLHQAGIDSVTYEHAVHECFRQMETVSEGEPVVTRAYAALKARKDT